MGVWQIISLLRLLHTVQLQRDAVDDANKKSPQIVGLRPPMCWAIFFIKRTLIRTHWIFWCICNYYDFRTHVNSKWLQPFATVWSYLTVEFWDPQLLGVRDFSQSKTHPRLPITREYKVGLEGRNVTNRNVVPTFLFDFYKDFLSCTVWPQYTTRQTETYRQRDRQSDRNRPPAIAWAA